MRPLELRNPTGTGTKCSLSTLVLTYPSVWDRPLGLLPQGTDQQVSLPAPRAKAHFQCDLRRLVIASFVKDTTPTLPPLPENEPRTFHLKNHTNYTGVIVDVRDKGIILKLTSAEYTDRLAWSLFADQELEREPKIIAYRAAQEALRLVTEAAAQAKAEKEEAAKRLADYQSSQDSLIESSIEHFGTKVVTRAQPPVHPRGRRAIQRPGSFHPGHESDRPLCAGSQMGSIPPAQRGQ